MQRLPRQCLQWSQRGIFAQPYPVANVVLEIAVFSMGSGFAWGRAVPAQVDGLREAKLSCTCLVLHRSGVLGLDGVGLDLDEVNGDDHSKECVMLRDDEV